VKGRSGSNQLLIFPFFISENLRTLYELGKEQKKNKRQEKGRKKNGNKSKKKI